LPRIEKKRLFDLLFGEIELAVTFREQRNGMNTLMVVGVILDLPLLVILIAMALSLNTQNLNAKMPGAILKLWEMSEEFLSSTFKGILLVCLGVILH
jgi:hypothetical protein